MPDEGTVAVCLGVDLRFIAGVKRHDTPESFDAYTDAVMHHLMMKAELHPCLSDVDMTGSLTGREMSVTMVVEAAPEHVEGIFCDAVYDAMTAARATAIFWADPATPLVPVPVEYPSAGTTVPSGGDAE